MKDQQEKEQHTQSGQEEEEKEIVSQDQAESDEKALDQMEETIETTMNIPPQSTEDVDAVEEMISAEDEKIKEEEKSPAAEIESTPEEIPQPADTNLKVPDKETSITAEQTGSQPTGMVNKEISETIDAKEPEKAAIPSKGSETDSDTDDDDESDQDSDRDTEIDELESAEHYADLDKEEIISRLQELAKETDPDPVRKKFFALRKAYLDNQRQEREQAYQLFINEGGAVEDYQMPAPTAQDDQVRELTAAFKQKITDKREKREKEKQENLAAKKEIIEELKRVIQNEENILHAFDAIHELQARWRSIGIVPLEHAEDLWQNYRFYVGKFYDLIRIHKELQELDQKKNLEAKLALCDQAEDLLLEESINKAVSRLRELQDKWRDTGPVPKENNEEIWDRFKAVADKIYDRRRSFIDELKAGQETNLLQKTELCEKAEKIASEKPEKPGEWQKLTDALKNLQEEWRKIGPAPRQHNEKIWKRFRDAGDKHFNDKKEYFSALKREQDINKQKKTDLCVQAESLKDSTEWRETADALKNLQEEWKSIGPVHPKYNQKLWERFRAACDVFFSNRSQHMTELDKEFTVNLEKKTALVEEIEKFEPSDDKAKDLEKLKSAQKEWSEIGRVPIKMKDKIYQRYRRALDRCYEKLNLSFADRRNLTTTNRIEQLEQRGRQLTPKDKSSVRYKIDKLQDEIRLLENNIGFFSNSKQASKLKEDYEKKIELAKSEVENLKALLSKS